MVGFESCQWTYIHKMTKEWFVDPCHLPKFLGKKPKAFSLRWLQRAQLGRVTRQRGLKDVYRETTDYPIWNLMRNPDSSTWFHPPSVIGWGQSDLIPDNLRIPVRISLSICLVYGFWYIFCSGSAQIRFHLILRFRPKISLPISFLTVKAKYFHY